MHTTTAPSPTGAQLGLTVVGRFAVRSAGRWMPAPQVGSRKARRLLALLAVHCGYVPVDRIAVVLWETRTPSHPAANVATLVSRLRAALGAGTITGDRAGYRLGDHVRVDLAEAAVLVTEAEAQCDPTEALDAARQAGTLLDAGTVLADEPDALWAEPARVEQARLLRRARHLIAETALRLGRTKVATAAAEAALAADTLDETACRLLMRAHDLAGEPARALRVYHLLRTTLVTELGVDPAPATRGLYQEILSG